MTQTLKVEDDHFSQGRITAELVLECGARDWEHATLHCVKCSAVARWIHILTWFAFNFTSPVNLHVHEMEQGRNIDHNVTAVVTPSEWHVMIKMIHALGKTGMVQNKQKPG